MEHFGRFGEVLQGKRGGNGGGGAAPFPNNELLIFRSWHHEEQGHQDEHRHPGEGLGTERPLITGGKPCPDMYFDFRPLERQTPATQVHYERHFKHRTSAGCGFSAPKWLAGTHLR